AGLLGVVLALLARPAAATAAVLVAGAALGPLRALVLPLPAAPVRPLALPSLRDGRRIALDARLEGRIGFRNPGMFDYGEYLIRHDIVVVGTTRGDRIVALEPEAPRWPGRIRRQAVAASRGALPPTSAALLAGLLLGDRTGLPPDVDAAFRRAGVYHVLAVSGFNVALIASTVWALLTLA